MKFEYDKYKSLANKEKHGIDFEQAKELWHDENLLVLPLPFTNEKRYSYIGMIQNKLWASIVTCRNNGEHIRIISVRRARKDEVEKYEEE